MMHRSFLVWLTLVLAGCVTTSVDDGQSLKAHYERSIIASAVREPGFGVDLLVIPASMKDVRLATFTEWGPPRSPTERFTWVSGPEQLRTHCRGRPNAVLAIQQALGLPPRATPSKPDNRWQVISFTVARATLFRPCPGGTDVASPRCSVEKVAPDNNSVTGGLDADMVRFLLEQIWSSHKRGFDTPGSERWGYPFTGMGWTYNWDPQASSPVGVTEFVVRKGAVLSNIVAETPEQFCSAK